ncbi:MAG: DUF2807 domain-containing protein [Duncaniella sp.]|uniref:GIN domain-containing protein n=1 Tax=Duncaniella sp. TaxID=2518496 RepID=UPI0023D2C691|nr:DUF2807 domain-containing protein [Duncaniella sp.]MDE6089328.1 DUF2807 domain-containing protein [Duncaniella sp.]
MKLKAFFSLMLLFGFIGVQAADLVKYELNVGEFHELKVTDGLNVVYSCNPDSAGLAVFTSPSSQASAFIFNNNKGKLSMKISTENVGVTNLPVVTVYSTYLTKIENAGDSLVKVVNVANGPKFTAKLIGNGRMSVQGVKATEVTAALSTGNGTLVINGECEHVNFNFTGTGVIQADGLEAQTASVKAGGTGSIGLWAVKTLSVMGMGSTKLYYKGNPEIKNRSVGIKTFPLGK